MKTHALLGVLFGATTLAGSLAGCDWRTFNELKDDIWVDSQTRPSGVASAEYGDQVFGLTIADTEGTTIGVLGRNQESLSTLVYDADGAADTGVIIALDQIDLGDTFNFREHQPLAVKPGTDRYAIALVSEGIDDDDNPIGNFKVIVLDSEETTPRASYEPEFLEDSISGREPVQSLTFAGDHHLVASRSTELALIDEDGMPNQEITGCHLPAGEAAFAVAFGEVGAFVDDLGVAYPDVVAGGDIIVASAPVNSDCGELGVECVPTGPGRLWVLVGGLALDTDGANCIEAFGVAIDGIDVARGSQLIVTDFGEDAANTVVVSSVANDGEVNLVDFTTGTPEITGTLQANGLNAIAVGDLDGDGRDELILGQPTYDSEGITRSGQVVVYASDSLEQALPALYDAEPTEEQRYGTSVAVVEFTADGETHDILTVGATGEVFTYFQTALYADVRAGRE